MIWDDELWGLNSVHISSFPCLILISFLTFTYPWPRFFKKLCHGSLVIFIISPQSENFKIWASYTSLFTCFLMKKITLLTHNHLCPFIICNLKLCYKFLDYPTFWADSLPIIREKRERLTGRESARNAG